MPSKPSSIDLYKPKPVSYQKVVEVLETEAIQVTRWPQSVVCARIERVKLEDCLIV
jgi:hypothetical protein